MGKSWTSSTGAFPLVLKLCEGEQHCTLSLPAALRWTVTHRQRQFESDGPLRLIMRLYAVSDPNTTSDMMAKTSKITALSSNFKV